MAGKRIQGITIEIGGDTKKLTAALKDSNAEIRKCQNNLKDIDKLLKLDPGNTQLLQQKFRNLGDEVTATEKKLDALRDAEKQAAQALADGSVSQQDFDGLQREIIETEQQLKNLEKEYKNFGSVAAQQVAVAGEKMKAIGHGMKDLGGSLTKGVTVPIAGIGAASAAAWSEVDQAMDTVITKTGATGSALEDMQKRVQNIAQDIPTSFQDAADAVGEVNTRFGLTGDLLEQTASKFIKFAKINKTDVASSIDLVQSAMAAYNVPAQEAGMFLDTLNRVGQDTGVSLDGLTSLMMSNAASLKELGYSASDSAVLLGSIEKAGVDSSAAVSGLRRAYSQAIKEGVSMTDVLSDLETRLQNADTYADAAGEAMTLFGTRAGGALVSAISEGRLSFDALGTTLSDYAGSVSATFEETLDPLDQMQATLNTLKLVGADLVTTAGPMIADVMSGLAEIVRGLADAWGGLTEDQQQMILKLAGIAAVAGPVISVLGSLTSGIGSIMTLAPKVTGAFGSVINAIGGLGSSAGKASSSLSSIGSAAGTVAGPAASAGSAMGTLAQNALGFIALGAGIFLAATGLAMLAKAAIDIGQAGAPAAIAMAAMVGVIALLAVGAAALGPALTAGAVGLIAFGAAVALVGAGVLAASAGLAMIADRLPGISEYGADAAVAILELAAALTGFAAGALAAGGGAAALALGLGGTAVSVGGLALAAAGLTVAILALAAGVLVLSGGVIGLAAGLLLLAAGIDAVGKAIKSGTVNFVDSFNLIRDTAKDTLQDISDGFTSTFDGVKKFVGGAVDWLKDIFDFEWSLPKIKLPHFSITGSFSLDPPSIPHIGIDWYKKAMDDGMILNRPTIFGASGGRLLGAGDAGPEAVVGADSLRDMVSQAVAAAAPGGGNITIPVYIGNHKIDTVVVDAIQRANYRSGGR